VIDWLNGRGLAPVIVLEDAEEQRFRERFATQFDGRLDWPPATEIHGRVRVRIYNPSQRLSYERGQPVQTEHIR
jgi:trans-aconitate methyltransferase